MKFLNFIIIFLLIIGCKKTEKSIYELKPDKEYFFVKKENGDSLKIAAEPFLLDYSKPKFLTISRFNSDKKKL